MRAPSIARRSSRRTYSTSGSSGTVGGLPLSLLAERERRALRIDTLHDPVAAGDFDRTVHHLPAVGLDAPGAGMDVRDAEVEAPVWRSLRHLWRPGHDAADLEGATEGVIRAQRTDVDRVDLLPAKQLGVELHRRGRIDRIQLAPRDVADFRLGFRLRRRRGRFVDREDRALRILHRAQAADGRHLDDMR